MDLSLALPAALWLGLLTAISPCPLATNIAAVSYVSKRVDKPRFVFTAGFIYALGRMVSYITVALLVIQGLLNLSALAMFLQRNLNRALGPLLLLVGLLLLDVLPWPWAKARSSNFFEKLQKQADKLGLWGAGLLGFVFAMTFCPVSAALFFGSLIPLALKHESPFLLPSFYGLGTAAPVVFFAFILAFSANRISRAFSALTLIEIWMRRSTALVFILVGGYYCLLYLFKLL